MSGEPVYEYDVNANGYDTVMNLTETQAKEQYPDAKRRSGPLAPDHPEHEQAAGRHAGGKARTAPNKGGDKSGDQPA